MLSGCSQTRKWSVNVKRFYHFALWERKRFQIKRPSSSIRKHLKKFPLKIRDLSFCRILGGNQIEGLQLGVFSNNKKLTHL